jgi:hypothetical protein
MPRKILNGLDLSNQRIQNVADPSSATDAANRQYVDNLARGLIIKDAVRVASTANITIATPGATIDGVTMATNDRVLLKDQSTPNQNGIYLWNGAAVAMTRALDADDGTEMRPGTTVFAREGSTNADKQFVITSDAAITIGTTAMTWTQFGGGTTYTGSNGVQLVGSDFRGVVAGSGGLTVGAGGFAIDTSVVTRKISGTMGNGSLTVIAVTHSLGTKDVDVTIRQTADDAAVETDWVATDTNTVTFTFASAPASNALRWTIMG